MVSRSIVSPHSQFVIVNDWTVFSSPIH